MYTLNVNIIPSVEMKKEHAHVTYLPFVGSIGGWFNRNCAGEQETFIFQNICMNDRAKDIVQIDSFEITTKTFH